MKLLLECVVDRLQSRRNTLAEKLGVDQLANTNQRFFRNVFVPLFATALRLCITFAVTHVGALNRLNDAVTADLHYFR